MLHNLFPGYCGVRGDFWVHGRRGQGEAKLSVLGVCR